MREFISSLPIFIFEWKGKEMKGAKGTPGIACMIMLFSILILIFISPVSAAEGTTIFVNNASAKYGDTIQITINVSNAKDIGSMDISLQYDPDILSLKHVEKGNLTQNSVMQWNIRGDKVLIGLIDGNGINGNGSIATLTSDVCGYPGSTSDLVLDATATNVSDFSPIQLITKNGKFTVIGGSTTPSPTATPTSTRTGSSGSRGIATSSKSGGLKPVTISIDNAYAYPNTTIKVPINVQNAINIGSLDFYLLFNSSVLHLIEISKSELTANSLLQWSIVNESKIRILIIDASGINGNGSLVYLNFNVIGAPRSITNLNLSELEVSDAISTEEIPAMTNNGTLTVKSAVSNETLVSKNDKTPVTEVPTQKTPVESPQSTKGQEPAKEQPGFEAIISASVIALLAILFMLRRNRR